MFASWSCNTPPWFTFTRRIACEIYTSRRRVDHYLLPVSCPDWKYVMFDVRIPTWEGKHRGALYWKRKSGFESEKLFGISRLPECHRGTPSHIPQPLLCLCCVPDGPAGRVTRSKPFGGQTSLAVNRLSSLPFFFPLLSKWPANITTDSLFAPVLRREQSQKGKRLPELTLKNRLNSLAPVSL